MRASTIAPMDLVAGEHKDGNVLLVDFTDRILIAVINRIHLEDCLS